VASSTVTADTGVAVVEDENGELARRRAWTDPDGQRPRQRGVADELVADRRGAEPGVLDAGEGGAG